MPFCHVSQIARIARIISRMRGAGWLHSMLNRLVMCGLIWLPSPRMNRPLENACRSQPMWASVIGLRANATAIDVPSSSCSVCSAASSKREERIVCRLRGPRSVVSRCLGFLGARRGLGELVTDSSVDFHCADRNRRLGQFWSPVRCPGLAGTVRTRRPARRRWGCRRCRAGRSAAWPGRRASSSWLTIARCSSLLATS